MKKGSALEKKVLNDLLLQKVFCLKIPEGARHIGRKLIPHKTVYDFIAIGNCWSAAFDAKECGKDSFYFQSYVFDKKKIHQYNALTEAKAYGLHAGYLIHFTNHKRISWLSIERLQEMHAQGLKSAHPDNLPGIPELDIIVMTRLFL